MPKKIDRSTKKWRELYRLALTDALVKYGDIKHASTWHEIKEAFSNAMPDRIKEAEEYADRLYSAMR